MIISNPPQTRRINGHSNKNKSKTKREGHPFRITPYPIKKENNGEGQRRMDLYCDRTCKNSEFSIQIDENTDATCDTLWWNSYAKIKQLKLNGTAIPNERFIDNGKAVPLGDLQANQTYRIEVIYKVPEGTRTLKKQELVIQPQIIQRKRLTEEV